MIILADVKAGDTVKVLLCDDGIEEDTYAKVVDVFPTCMSVRYYTATSKVYKGACLYELDEDENPVEVESLMEHYPDGETPLSMLNDTLAYIEDEVYPDEDSEIHDLSDEDEDDLEDFVAADGLLELPEDHEEVDRNWNQWEPPTTGGRRFKALIDAMDRMAREEMDNQQFSIV